MSNDETTTATPDPVKYAPTGVNMSTHKPVWRAFTSKQHWVNKAATWMRRGDKCFDSTGRELLRGSDFDSAAYPAYIARPREAASS